MAKKETDWVKHCDAAIRILKIMMESRECPGGTPRPGQLVCWRICGHLLKVFEDLKAIEPQDLGGILKLHK